MSYVKSECPHCSQHIEYPEEGAGLTIPCPTCGKSFKLTAGIPARPTPPEAGAHSSDTTRRTLAEVLAAAQDQEAIIAFLDSEEGQIEMEIERLNVDWAADYRKVTREEVEAAWAHVKRATGKPPGDGDPAKSTLELRDAMIQLFPDYRASKVDK